MSEGKESRGGDGKDDKEEEEDEDSDGTDESTSGEGSTLMVRSLTQRYEWVDGVTLESCWLRLADI